MMRLFRNIGYFFREAGKVLWMNRLSYIFSFIGTVLVLFIFGLAVSGWRISDQFVDMLQQEAEISAYFEENINIPEAEKLVDFIKTIDGVWDARYVGTDEAHHRMEEILGDEASILELFEQNPFEAFIEVRIDLDKMDNVLEQLKYLKGIDYVRDNRDILEQLQGIAQALEVLVYLIIAAVSITTMVLISHMIRQAIYQNKEHIYTLRLLGAPNRFIGFPYLLVGMLLTLLGGILASISIVYLLREAYGQMKGILPFIPLPALNELAFWPVTSIMGISILLGLLGSLFGISSANKEKRS
jgi:cell division transport system permease protein